MTITPAPEVLAFLDTRIGLGKPFKDRTHAFESAVACLMREEGIEPSTKPTTKKPRRGT